MSKHVKPRPSGGTPATVVLEQSGVVWRSHHYDHDPATASYGLEAADALGVDPARVLKTLLVQVDQGLAVGVVAVDRQLDLKAVAAVLGSKRAVLAPVVAAERSTGYVVGGISPLGQRRPLPTVVDVGALAHETVYVSGGRRGFDVELSPGDLVTLTGARPAAISR
ncbi:MAG: Cys-tRNA(Pro) deacylase [Actinomycetota bacterium]|nr:Cys-tRNA(Pro) deacylase [Actinomycetota bacterium]